MKISVFTLVIIILNTIVFGQMSITTSSGTTNLTAGGGSPSSCAGGNFKVTSHPTVSGSCVTMTPANTSDNNAAFWSCNAFNLDSSFKLTASVTFGSNVALGDGIVFVLKKRFEGDRMGYAAGYLGYHNTTASGTPIGMSLGVEFDTYDAPACGTCANNGDSGPTSNCNHAQIVRNGDLNLKVGGKTCLKSGGTSVNDGLSHAICITWIPPSTLAAGGTFKAYIDGREVASAGDIRTYFDTKEVYWGFTAGDGAGTNLNNHIICNANMTIRDARKTSLNPSCLVTLPIEIKNFTSESIDEKTNKLTWQTSSERDNAFFTLERSRDGVVFETFAQIDGAGNSNTDKMYEYIDYNPYADRTYYKLSQTDFDGKVNILGIKYVENENLEYTEVSRNPFEDDCKLRVKSSSNAPKQITVFDAMGKKVHEEKLYLNRGINDVSIDFTNHVNGIYMILIEHNNSSENFKVVKFKQ